MRATLHESDRARARHSGRGREREAERQREAKTSAKTLLLNRFAATSFVTIECLNVRRSMLYWLFIFFIPGPVPLSCIFTIIRDSIRAEPPTPSPPPGANTAPLMRGTRSQSQLHSSICKCKQCTATIATTDSRSYPIRHTCSCTEPI